MIPMIALGDNSGTTVLVNVSGTQNPTQCVIYYYQHQVPGVSSIAVNGTHAMFEIPGDVKTGDLFCFDNNGNHSVDKMIDFSNGSIETSVSFMSHQGY